jgi:hypothetical protein
VDSIWVFFKKAQRIEVVIYENADDNAILVLCNPVDEGREISITALARLDTSTTEAPSVVTIFYRANRKRPNFLQGNEENKVPWALDRAQRHAPPIREALKKPVDPKKDVERKPKGKKGLGGFFRTIGR